MHDVYPLARAFLETVFLQKEHPPSSTNPNDPEYRTRNVSLGLGSLAAQNIITSILAFVFIGALLRLTSPKDFTAYSSVSVSVLVAISVSTFALQYAAARYVALFLKDDEEKAWAFGKAILVLSVAFSVAGTIVFDLISPELSMYFMRNTQWTFLFILGGLWLVSYSLSSILQGIIQGMKKYVFLARIITISRVAMLGFAIATLELYHNVDFAIISWVIYYIILIIWPLRKIAPQIFRKSSTSYYTIVLKYCAPLAIAAILGIVSTSGDSVVIGGYTTSLGPYNAAIQISATLYLIVITPLITALLPEAASSSESSIQISNVLRLAVRFLILGLLPVSLLMAALSPQLLALFSGGGTYLSATGVLEIVSVTYVFYGMQLMIYSLLLAVGRTIQALITVIAAAAADVGFALLLVPNFGMEGGAISRVLESLIGMLISIYFARKYFGKLDTLKFYAKGIAASAALFAIVFSLTTFVGNGTISLIPYSIIGVVLFLFLIKTTHILNDEDRGFISHALPSSLKRFLRYL
jgi:O-antigen/teichoic acid export membrane protein